MNYTFTIKHKFQQHLDLTLNDIEWSKLSQSDVDGL